MPKPSLLRRVKTRLAPFRRGYEHQRRVVFTVFFRSVVRVARALHMLPSAARATGPEHILVVNLTHHLGDTIMLLPLLERLRGAHPAARIDVAVEAGAASLLRAANLLDNVYALPLGGEPPVTHAQARHRVLAITRFYVRELRALRPTVTINPRWGDDLFRSSVLAALTGAPRRIAYASSVVTVAPYRDSLSTELHHGGHRLQESVRYAELAASAGLLPAASLATITTQPIPSVARIAKSIDWPALRERLALPIQRFAIIAPGASMPRRIWPVNRWAEVARRLIAGGVHVVILSGKADAATSDALFELLPRENVTVIAGTTSLLESLALIAHADIFLGNDSGPGHIAGALGVRTTILFTVPFGADPDAPSAPERVHPVGPHVVSLAPPHCIAPCTTACVASEAHCITLIGPEDVLQSNAS